MFDLLHDLGYVLLGGVFVWAGTEHSLNFRTVSAQLKERGFPAPVPLLLGAGSFMEIAAGLCVVINLARAYAAFALVGFTAAASLLALDFWRYSGAERQMLRSGFIINVAVAGGLLLAATC
ncbi:DoxX family protein [Mesorhizobium sp. BAC0120]|uniref:DoxX family protein n=1 Tax=Mesorhizobium sp. BAC0120 TaxID=3090670 RepID=UPI00298CC78C|nr:DoxX family protein [Mesorhizobium sp. BAC0120]MDW6021831.1 DoxX family protein [Mesorhizobium sp. BAC0120]